MSFHTFGDSHAVNGWCLIPGVQPYSPGPWTAYGFGRDGVGKFDITKIVGPGDSICFCMGEIDCRCHIHKHITEERDVYSVVGYVVDKYVSTIAEHRKRVDWIKVYAYSVPPTVRSTSNHQCGGNWPLLGTDDERKKYVSVFNASLSEKCKEYDVGFIDVCSKYQDSEHFLADKYSDGTVHIADPVFIIETIKELGCTI